MLKSLLLSPSLRVISSPFSPPLRKPASSCQATTRNFTPAGMFSILYPPGGSCDFSTLLPLTQAKGCSNAHTHDFIHGCTLHLSSTGVWYEGWMSSIFSLPLGGTATLTPCMRFVSPLVLVLWLSGPVFSTANSCPVVGGPPFAVGVRQVADGFAGST